MKSPFVKASCGCIVIPLHKLSDKIDDYMVCILIKPCDGEGDWCFHERPFEPCKVIKDENVDYSGRSAEPRLLDEAETAEAIKEINKLVCLGYRALQISGALNSIDLLKRREP
jgi:hypothetical protein